MTEEHGNQIFTDAAWAVWEPLIEAVRPPGKTPPEDLRRTISAIVWRHQNGAKWRSVPTAFGPWWRAAPLFIRWAKRGVWERVLELVQQRALALGMSFLDGTTIRAHATAAGAQQRGPTAHSALWVKHLAPAGQARGLKAHRAAAMAPKPA